MQIGIDLGGSHISCGIIESGKVLKQVGQDIIEKNNIENLIINGINNLINELLNGKSKDNIEKIGISAPGIISNGTIVKAANLNLYNFELITKLKEKFENIEITLRNDGKCAAIAEKKYGVMKEYKDAVFLNIGTGIGGAVFLDDKLLEPKKSSGFEFGHMIIEKNGLQCTCEKKGCFEQYASITALKQMVKNELNLNYNITGKELRNIIEENSKRLEKIINEYIENLSIGLSNIIDIFEPEIICFGGSFSNYENIMIKKLQEKLKENGKLFSKSILPELKMAKLGNDAGFIGAILDK